jgi:hypothetical protein
MAVDLAKLAEKLKQQRNVGVSRDGRLTERDPNNDGTQRSLTNYSTLEPKRFYVS